MQRFECGGRWWFVGQQATASGFLLHGHVVSLLSGDWVAIRGHDGRLHHIHAAILEPAP